MAGERALIRSVQHTVLKSNNMQNRNDPAASEMKSDMLLFSEHQHLFFTIQTVSRILRLAA